MIRMENKSLKTFEDSKNLIREYKHWKLLIRNRNQTLGNCVLILKRPVTRFSEATPEEFLELHDIIVDIETALKKAFGYNIMNYQMLMMKDKEVHFHIIPRYDGPRKFAGLTWTDEGWPGLPGEMKKAVSQEILDSMKKEIILDLP